jgi:hypothetical protein
MEEWEGDMRGKFSDQLTQIMTEIEACGANTQRLFNAIKALQDEIPDAYQLHEVMAVLAAINKIKSLEKKHLLKDDPAHPGQKIPINNAYQISSNLALLHLAEDHIAEDPKLLEVRKTLGEAVTNDQQFATTTATIMQWIKDHRPAKLQPKTQHSSQRSVMAHSAHLTDDMDDGDMFGAADDDDDNTREVLASTSTVGQKRAASPMAKQVDQRPPQPQQSRQICTFFPQGKCQYGERCNRIHEKSASAMHQVEMTTEEFNLYKMQRSNTASRMDQAANAKTSGTAGAMHPTGKYNQG